MEDIEQNLAKKGLTLPSAMAVAGNYLPYIIVDSMVFISGQISADAEGELITGKLGDDLTVEQGYRAAKRCSLAILSQLKQACNSDWQQVKQAVKLTGFVNSTPTFIDQPSVINGASDLFVEILGERGRHSRSAVSAATLPRGAAVEVEAIFKLAV